MTATPPSSAAAPLMDIKEICKLLCCTQRTLQRWIREERFPPPLRLSPRTLRWRREDIQQYLARLNAERRLPWANGGPG